MQKLDRASLWSLEEYAKRRPTFRQEAIAHKKRRRVTLGPHASLFFEDFLTMKYQVQETLRTERIFEPEEIEHELTAYAPLVPDGSNWKATLMIEYEDVEERRRALARLPGVENTVWVRVGDRARVYAIANEDLPRSNEEKASAVHFLRFELTAEMVADAKRGAAIGMGIEHPEIASELSAVPEDVRLALVQDLS